jgi:hypothetical protein
MPLDAGYSILDSGGSILDTGWSGNSDSARRSIGERDNPDAKIASYDCTGMKSSRISKAKRKKDNWIH